MYEYKQFRVWLVIIPFWVLHIFGTPSILSSLSGYDFFSLKKSSVSINSFGSLDPCEDDDLCNMDENSEYEYAIIEKNACRKNLKHFFKRLHKLKKQYAQGISVCDNRIDRMDKRFVDYLRDKDLDIEDRAWVTVA